MRTRFLKSFKSLAFILLTAPLIGGAVDGGTDEVVGEVVELVGSAVAVQEALPRILKVGAKIQKADVISTGRASRLQLRMIDDGEFSLGERASFVVEEYFLQGDGKSGNAAVRLLSGAILGVSGKIAQLDGSPFVLKTEVATIGVRGTTFWGGLLDGSHQYALLDGRAIIVETKGGRVEITRVGDGTVVASETSAPAAPSTWAPEKLERAAAMTR